MPNNTPPPPPPDERSAHNAHIPYQELNAQNLLMQLLATRQQQNERSFEGSGQQHDPIGDDNGAMLSSLNETVMRHHYQQQHGSLQQQQDTTRAHHDARTMGYFPRNQAGSMPHEFSQQFHTLGNSELQASNMLFHEANLQQSSLDQLQHLYNNPSQGQADNDMLSMILMANQQVNTPSFVANQYSPSERERSNLANDSEMLQAYNQDLTALIASSNNRQQQHFGDAASMASAGIDSRSHTTGVASMNHPSLFSPTYLQQGHVHNRGIPHMYQDFSEGVGSLDIPDRIVPTGIGQGMIDIPFGAQQRNLHDTGVEGKRSGDVDAWEAPKRKKRRSQRKQPTDKPRRALSAYNLFFSAERARILKEIEVQEGGTAVYREGVEAGEETEACRALQRPLVPSEVKRRPHRKTHGKIGFQNLAQTVALRWRQLSAEQKSHYQDLADADLLRHKDAMEEYFTKQAVEKQGSVVELKEKGNNEGDLLDGDIDGGEEFDADDIIDRDDTATDS